MKTQYCFSTITIAIAVALIDTQCINGWTISTSTPHRNRHHLPSIGSVIESQQQRMTTATALRLSEQVSSESAFSEEEVATLTEVFNSAEESGTALKETLLKSLETMDPGLIVKLRTLSMNDPNEKVQKIGETLASILEDQMGEAKVLLESFLEAGEIRKLDALIGKAARDGKLNAPFFSVLNMNLQDAIQTLEYEVKEEEGSEDETDTASRQQILQHVYTRCQEELEKTIPPGVALLNKLLRTNIDSIRANQLQHYLCPRPNIITTPDGKELELEGAGLLEPLVAPSLLVEALGNAVKQIRTVERAGGTDRVSAASMVESLREIAKEARMTIAKEYGMESDELKSFEDGLQPVFRPSSADSPYMQGQ